MSVSGVGQLWRYISRTDGGRLDHVADGESLDRLVLWRASRAIGAADGLDVAAALLVTTAGILISIPTSAAFLKTARTWTLAS